MSKMKRIMAMLLMTVLMVPTVAVSAATPSVTKTTIGSSNISVKDTTTVVYSGKAQTVDVTVTVNGKTLVKGVDYIIELPSKTAVGTYTVTVKVVGIGRYAGTVTKNVKLVINKVPTANVAKNNIKVPKKAKVVKATDIKKKAKTVKVKVKKVRLGKVFVKKIGKAKKLKIKVKKIGKKSSQLRIKLPKNTKPGVYKIKVCLKKNKTHKRSKYRTIKIRVK